MFGYWCRTLYDGYWKIWIGWYWWVYIICISIVWASCTCYAEGSFSLVLYVIKMFQTLIISVRKLWMYGTWTCQSELWFLFIWCLDIWDLIVCIMIGIITELWILSALEWTMELAIWFSCFPNGLFSMVYLDIFSNTTVE